jgi:hypothetical protein
MNEDKLLCMMQVALNEWTRYDHSDCNPDWCEIAAARIAAEDYDREDRAAIVDHHLEEHGSGNL